MPPGDIRLETTDFSGGQLGKGSPHGDRVHSWVRPRAARGQGSTGRPKSVRGPRMFPVKVHGAAPYLTSEARRDYTGAPYRRSKFVRVTKMHISGQKRICRSTVCYTFIISCKASLQRLKIPIFLHIYVQERFRRLHHVGTPHFPWTTLRRNKNSNPVQVHSVQQVYSLVFRFRIEP
jgi:hypothetical protein